MSTQKFPMGTWALAAAMPSSGSRLRAAMPRITATADGHARGGREEVLYCQADGLGEVA